MPMFDNLMSRLSEKLEDAAKFSDVNHELGKVRDSLLHESSSYFNSVKRNLLIRSESTTRFPTLFKNSRNSETKLIPKSKSLPVIDVEKESFHKYRYRSSIVKSIEEEETITSPLEDEIERLEETIVSKFIKVVESPSVYSKRGGEQRRKGINSREEIRRKLAELGNSGGEERPNGYKRGFVNNNKDLEICFINETASDEDEDVYVKDREDRRRFNDSTSTTTTTSEDEDDKDEDDKDEENNDKDGGNEAPFPSSRTDWKNYRNFSPLKTRPEDAKKRNRYRKRIRKLQREAQIHLQNCEKIAKRKILAEKQKRKEDDDFLRKLGIDVVELNRQSLSKLNIATLQVIVNNSHTKIENFNEQLVKLLLEKDELQIEQEGQLVDIEDLTLKI